MTSTEMLARWSIDSGYVAPRKSSWDTPLMKDYVGKYPQAITARDQLQYAHAELPVKNIIEVKRAIVSRDPDDRDDDPATSPRSWPRHAEARGRDPEVGHVSLEGSPAAADMVARGRRHRRAVARSFRPVTVRRTPTRHDRAARGDNARRRGFR